MKEQTEPQKFDPRQYLAIYIFRWKIIVLCALWCMLAGVLFLVFARPKYLTNCTVQIWRDPTLRVSQYGGSWQPLSTHVWILTGRELEDKTLNTLKDAPSPDGRTWREKLGGIQNMKTGVQVNAVRGQNGVLTLSIVSPDQEYARAYLAELWRNFEEKAKVMKVEISSTAFKVLEDEIKLLEEGIENAENDLVDYARLNQLDLTAAKGSIESRYLMALLSYQNQLDTELMLLEAQFPVLRDEDPTVILDAGSLTREAGSVTPVEGSDTSGDLTMRSAGDKVLTGWGSSERAAADNPEVREWQSRKVRLTELEMRAKDLLAKFNPDHPELREVQRSIAELRNEIRLSSQVAFGRLMDRRKALRIAKNALEVPVRTWKNTYSLANQKQAAYRRKTLAVQRQEGMYRDLYSRLYDLKVSEELKSDHIRIIEPVRTQDKPVWPKPASILLVALVLALGSGFGLATVAHVFDNRMQTVSDVETVLGIPFLGGVPHWARRGAESSVRPLVLEEHSSGAIEAYRVLRTSVMDALEKTGRKTLLVTSAESREGKTLTALNLAVMIAKVGKKVLLTDMDLRRPRIHKSFGLERTPGMTEVLNGKCAFDAAVVPTNVENLWLLPGGESCESAAELLQSSNLPALFSKAVKDYDYIIMDTSPVLRTADASIIASPEFCSVMFVASVNRTPKPLVRYSLDLLGKSHVLGVVMNNIEMNKVSSLYYSYQYPNYAYYAYAYAYGYDYDYFYAEGRRQKTRRGSRRLGEALRSFGKSVRRTFLPLE